MSQSPVQVAQDLIKSLEREIDTADLSPNRVNA